LLDRFFVGFTKVQICSLKLPPLFFFWYVNGSGRSRVMWCVNAEI
jgi:hypothetical protein